MEPRIAKLAVLETDMNDRFNKTEAGDQRIDALRTEMTLRFENVDERFKHVDYRFDQVDRRIDEAKQQINQRFDDHKEYINQRFDQVDLRLEEIKDLRQELHTFSRWMIGSQIAIVLWLLGLAAKLFSMG